MLPIQIMVKPVSKYTEVMALHVLYVAKSTKSVVITCCNDLLRALHVLKEMHS